MATYAQKKASQAYRDKLKEQGQTQHLIFANEQQWNVIKPVAKAIKSINLDGLTSVEVDDNGEYIHFIYDNRSETRVFSPKQTQDDNM